MANLGPAPRAQFFTADGQPLVGGKVYTYAAGTTTPLATYTSASGASANTNPIILDGRGECNIWFSPTSTYKIKLTDSNDVEIYVVDNITSSGYISNGTIVGSSIINGTVSGGTISGSAILGGSINNVIIGATTPTTATFTTFSGTWASLPAGTRMLFVQSSAPTGWTKSLTDDNKALRIVSGTAGTGGTVAFTTAFSAQAITGTTDPTILDATQIPAHTHTYTAAGGVIGVQAGASYNVMWSPGGTPTTSTGGGLGHTHTFSAGSINLAVQYVDAIIAVKN